MKGAVLAAAFALALYAGSAAVAAPSGGGKPADPGAAAVIVDANGKVVGPIVPIPFEPGTLYYGDVGAAYRVGTAVARVGFLARGDGNFGVLSRPVLVSRLYFANSNCTGQAYGDLPRDYLPYSTVFVIPPMDIAGTQVAPARIMQRTTRTQLATTMSRTGDETGTGDTHHCEQAVNSGEFRAVDLIGDFPFVAPFSTR